MLAVFCEQRALRNVGRNQVEDTAVPSAQAETGWQKGSGRGLSRAPGSGLRLLMFTVGVQAPASPVSG